MAIHSTTTNLGNLVRGRRIEIPPIQRDYAWKVVGKDPSADQLWNDLVTFHFFGDIDSSYYLGNMISWADMGGKNVPLDDPSLVWELLDGQQRLTSLTMIFNSIWIELNKIESEEFEELGAEIYYNFLFANEDRFQQQIEEEGAKSSLLPRREETKHFLLWLITQSNDLPSTYSGFNPNVNMHQVALTYHLRVRELIHKHGIDELVKFYKTMRDRVLVGVTITDDLNMGFQMFQTANARGTSLTSYDMFRAFSIKRAKVNLRLEPQKVKQIVSKLNTVEKKLLRFGDKDTSIEKETKSVMTAWTSCRTGKHNRENEIIKTLELDIDSIDKFSKLSGIIDDLNINARTWMRYKTPAPGQRYDAEEKAWNIIGRLEELGFSQHWSLYLALRTAQRKEGWNENVVEKYLSIIQWSIVKSVIVAGVKLGGNTNTYQQKIPIDCHYIWNMYMGNPNEITEEIFSERKKFWLIEHPRKANATGFEGLSITAFEDLKYIKVLLHLIDKNLCTKNPRGAGQRVLAVKLFDAYTPEFSNLDLADSNRLGNYFLIRGSKSAGWTAQKAKDFSKIKDLGKKLREIKKLSSQDPINSVSSITDASQIRIFIRKRTEMIKQRLEQGFQEALGSTLDL